MKSLARLVVLGASVALLAILIVPVIAQDAPGPGQGGIIIEGTFGSDPVPFNPLVCSESTCQQIAAFLLPGLLGTDPQKAIIEPNVPGSLATGWAISDDGLTYTITLRDDYKWNDGTPVTAKDVIYSFEAIKSGTLQNTLFTFVLDTVDNMVATDDHTIVVTINAPDCRALSSMALPALPSHIMPADYAELNELDWNLSPTVTGGVFKFGEYRASEIVSLLADQNYPDAELGFVSPEGYIYKNVPDQTVLVEQFLAGETNFIDNPNVGRRADIRNLAAEGKVQVSSYAGDFFDYFAFNIADPTNPKDGLDEQGNPVPQGYHPIFGNKEVRQAIAKAVNIDELISKAAFGEGTRMTSYLMANSWAYNKDLPPIAYDPEAAMAMLDKVGWVDDDNNPETPRVAKGVTLPDGTSVPDGTPMTFTMIGNEGNSRRAAEGQLIQEELNSIGVGAQYQAIDFGTWQDQVNAQTFDVAMLAWQVGFPDDPDATQLFGPSGDVVGSGNNLTSFYNEEFVKLNEEARTLPGCDTEARAKIYQRMQEIMQDEVPYMWMYSINGMYAAAADVNNFSPYPQAPRWNIDAWYVG